MKTNSWNEEVEVFTRFNDAEYVQWLVSFAFALTVSARDTYEVGSDDILDSKRMRRFNELLHRTVGQLQHRIQGNQGYPDDVFLLMIREETITLGIDFSTLKILM